MSHRVYNQRASNNRLNLYHSICFYSNDNNLYNNPNLISKTIKNKTK